jgi:hypothetical protein
VPTAASCSLPRKASYVSTKGSRGMGKRASRVEIEIEIEIEIEM